MRSFGILFFSGILLSNVYGQTIRCSMDSVQVNVPFQDSYESYRFRATYNSSNKINGPVTVVSEKNDNEVIRFKSNVQSNYLVGLAIWYNRSGDTVCTMECRYDPNKNSPIDFRAYSELYIPIYLIASRQGWYKIYNRQNRKRGVAYACHYLNDKRHGKELHYYESGKLRTENNYSNDRLNGKHIFYYEDGSVCSTGQYIQDKKTGKWIDYHKNGKLYRMHSDYNGALDTMMRWDQHGRVMESGFYSNGESTGKYRLFHENGQQQIDLNYVNGKREGLKREWYDNGVHFDSCYFKDDVRHGSTYMWWSDGKLRKKAFYVDGIEDGEYELREENGKIFEKGKYKKGTRIGKWKIQNEEGKLVEVNYSDVPYEEVIPIVELQEEIAEEPIIDFPVEMPDNFVWTDYLNKSFSEKEKSMVKKYRSIQVKATVDKIGNCRLEILTPMKKKDHQQLVKRLDGCHQEWRPLKMMGRSFPSVVYFKLYLYG